jgi:hypothetical protein
MWTLTGSAGSATLSFTWSNSDAGSGLAATPTSGTAWLYSANWTEVGGNTAGTPNVTSGVNTSNPAANWTIGLTGALPVELTSFNAASSGSTVTLQWQTATEVNNYGFEVERRAVKSEQLTVNSWEKIGFVSGAGTSNSPKEYSYSDPKPTSGRYVYRLKQVTNDGMFKYSQSIEVEIVSVPKELFLHQNYPNPFNPTTTIRYDVPQQANVKIAVYDMIGREVATLVNETKEAGSYGVTLTAPQLASGIYFYKLSAGSYTSVKKLMLMK